MNAAMNAPGRSWLVIPLTRGLVSRAIALVGLSFSAVSLHGQNTITNVISSVVSYQFYDDIRDLSTNSLITSSAASYQFYDAFSDLSTNSLIMSPVASLQYFDWPTSVVVAQLDSSSAAYYYPPNAPYLQLARANEGEFQITIFEGAMPSLYSVEFSTNLVNWQSLTNATITPPNVGVQVNVAPSTNSAGFYRVVGQ